MDALERLNELAYAEYRVLSFDGSRLTIAGSRDLSYAHNVEVEFSEVSFISCPTDILEPTFRCATGDEAKTVGRLVSIDAGETLVAIDAGSSGSLERQVYFILAEGVRVSQGTVYYYERENLQPGERIAEWVKRGA
jgi:hypothetical protein